MKNLIYKFFKTFGFRVITNDKDLKVRNQTNLLKQETEKLKFLLSDQINYSKQLFKTYQDSKSQICQDWFVLDHLDLKKMDSLLKLERQVELIYQIHLDSISSTT